VVDHAGAATVLVPARDLTAQGFLSAPGRPLRVRVEGPARVRVEARPIHSRPGESPLDGWVTVSDGDRARVFPILGNRPAEGLVLQGPEGSGRVGTGVDFGESLAPGRHTLEVSGGSLPLLVRVFVARPLVPLAVLPPLTPELADDVATGTESFVPALDPRCEAAPDEPTIWVCRPARRSGPGDTPPAAPGAVADNSGAGERSPPAADEAPPPLLPVPAAVAPRGPVGLAQRPGGGPDTPAREALVRLLWRRDHGQVGAAAALVEGEQVAGARPREPGLQPLLGRLGEDAAWQPLPQVAGSAGVRLVEVAAWQPESPGLRLRAALLPPLRAEETVASGGETVGFSLSLLDRARVRIDLALDQPDFLVAVPAGVSYQVDQAPPVGLRLTPSAPQHGLALDLAPGDHVVRITLEPGAGNQFLRVRATKAVADQPPRPLVEPALRAYHVATPAEPLRLELEGPAWLRVDELRDGQTRSSYRALPAGWQTVAIGPTGGRPEALLRAFRHVPTGARAPRPPDRPSPTAPPVPPPLLTVADAPPTPWLLRDGLALGGQEDGTWSFSGSWARRRTVEEDLDDGAGGGADAERFFELAATYRHFDPGPGAHWQGGVLGRIRSEGGPTLGLTGEVSLAPFEGTPDLRLTAGIEAYAQRPGDPLAGEAGAAGTEWSVTARLALGRRWELGPKTHHVPRVGAFARWLSLDENGVYPAGRLDRDVFTRYKADHRRGLTLGDTLYHRPWLDTVWRVGAGLTTNEDLLPTDPDHLQVLAGWRQLAGDWDLDLEYRRRYYLSDDDRDEDLDRSTLRLSVARVWWGSEQQRLEARLDFSRDVDAGDNTVLFTLTWHGGRGRGYRDFRDTDLGFRDLLERAAHGRPASRLEGGTPWP
jgi:hypothetical protein